MDTYWYSEEMLTEHLRCLKVTAHERDPKKADGDLETRSQNEGPKQSPSSLSLSPDARLRGGTLLLLLLLLHHRRALLLLLAASRLHAPSLKICLPLCVCCCWLGLENPVHRSCYKVSFFFRWNSFDVVGNWLHLKQKRMSFSFHFVFLSLWFVSQ